MKTTDGVLPSFDVRPAARPPRVSIIVAVYNVEPFLEKCLQSLASQTLNSVEVLVVNDGSPDNSQLIIDNFATAYPEKFRALVKPNGGLSDARNFGLHHARGEYIGFVDGDDYVHEEMYELLSDKAAETDADIVVCGYEGLDLVTNKTAYHMQGLESHYGLSLRDNPDPLLVAAPYAWNKIYRRRLFEESGVRYPIGKLFEDIPVTYSLFAIANRIAKVQRPLYTYIQRREGAITHTYSPRNMEMFDTLTMLSEFYKREGLYDEFRDQLLWLHFRHTFNRFRELPQYDGFTLKRQFLAKSWQHLDEHFPGWREDASLRSRYATNYRFKSFVSPVAGYFYALAPAALHKKGEKTSAKFKSSKAKYKKTVKAWLHQKTYLNALYDGPVKKNFALFESFHGRNISCYPFYIMKELAQRGTHEIYVGTRDVTAAQRYLDANGISATPVRMYSREYLRVLATAGLLVNNVSFPPYFIKRPEQVYLNTWHGTPLKTLGKAMPRGMLDLPNIQRNFLKSDLLLFSNEFTRDCITRDYMLKGVHDGEPMVVGSPRNVAFFDTNQRTSIRRQLGFEDKRVYLYMPTWRGDNSQRLSIEKYRAQVEEHLYCLDAALDDDSVLLVKFHTLVASTVSDDKFKHIRPAPTEYETYELLNIADSLITDYSSVMFDFAVSGREILLFDYDLAQYQSTRGFYFDYKSLPFPSFQTAKDLGKHLSRKAAFRKDDAYSAFVDHYAPLDGPDSSKIFTDLLLEKITDPQSIRREAREVDLVFATGVATPEGQARFEELLDNGFSRPDVVFALPLARNAQVADEFLTQLEKRRNIQLNYVIITYPMQVTLKQAAAVMMNKATGLHPSALGIAQGMEVRRVFGNMRIRSAISSSKYRRFTELARHINETIAVRG